MVRLEVNVWVSEAGVGGHGGNCVESGAGQRSEAFELSRVMQPCWLLSPSGLPGQGRHRTNDGEVH